MRELPEKEVHWHSNAIARTINMNVVEYLLEDYLLEQSATQDSAK